MIETSKYVSMFILLLILATLYYSLFVLPQHFSIPKKHIIPLPGKETECIEGTTKACKINECAGIKECKNGKWIGCILKPICKPNSTAPCIENGCTVGYKVCNGCGDEYGDCIYNQNSSR